MTNMDVQHFVSSGEWTRHSPSTQVITESMYKILYTFKIKINTQSTDLQN